MVANNLAVVTNEVEVADAPEESKPEAYIPRIKSTFDAEAFLAEPMDPTVAAEFIQTYGVQPLKRTRSFDKTPWATFEEINLELPTRDKLFAFVRYSHRTGNGHAIPTAADKHGDRRPLLLTKLESDYLKVALKAVLTICNLTEQFAVSAVPVGSHRDSKFNVVLRPIVEREAVVVQPLSVVSSVVASKIQF